MEMASRRRSRCSLSGVAFLALAASSAASAPGCQAAGTPAFVAGRGAHLLVSGSARASRVPRARRPGGRGRLEMQKDSESGSTEEVPTILYDDRPKDYELKPGQVGVRFINTSGDPDVAIGAYPGEIVTSVAKRAGVKIATACCTGLCGTCTTDLEDANAESYRPGFGVVRACVTPVTLVPGAEEMVLDVYRNRSKKGNLNRHLIDIDDDDGDVQTLGDAMKRFADGWDEEFEPNYGGETKDGKKRGTFGHNLDPDMAKPVLSPRTQQRLENKHMYDDLPAHLKRRRGTGGRDQEEELDLAHQINLRQRLQKERRARVNYYLDNADRPMASVDDILMLSEEERDSRSRFFNGQPSRWEDVYGAPNLPEIDRELAESNGRRSEGAPAARMAAYRSARQIPRYRFHGDPPLEEQDKQAVENFVGHEQARLDPYDVAELDRQQMMVEQEYWQNNKFVWRDTRTGKEVEAIKAGKPTTQRGERREVNLPTCVACEGAGSHVCTVCTGTGVNVLSTGRHDLSCPRCAGITKVRCEACHGTGFGSTTAQ